MVTRCKIRESEMQYVGVKRGQAAELLCDTWPSCTYMWPVMTF